MQRYEKSSTEQKEFMLFLCKANVKRRTVQLKAATIRQRLLDKDLTSIDDIDTLQSAQRTSLAAYQLTVK